MRDMLAVALLMAVVPFTVAGCDQPPASDSTTSPSPVDAESTASSAAAAEAGETAPPDAEAQRIIAAAQKDFQTLSFCRDERLRGLLDVHRRYPRDVQVIALLDRALTSAADYDGLVALHTPAAEAESIAEAKAKADNATEGGDATSSASSGSARSSSPPSFRARLYVGYLMNAAGQHADAAEHLAPLAQTYPDDAMIAFQLAIAQTRLGRYDQAAALVGRHRQAMLQIDPAGAWTLDGLLHLHAGRLDMAEASLGRALAIAPETDDATHAMGRLFQLRGDQAAASTWVQRTAAIKDARRRRLRWRVNAAYLSVGWLDQRYDECLDRLDALERDALPEDMSSQAMLHFLRSHVLAKAGDTAESQAEMTAASALRAQIQLAGVQPSDDARLLEQHTRAFVTDLR